MSSTVAVLCIDAVAGWARWTHLGDTRILFFRRGDIEQLTRDHSVVQSFIDAGVYDGEMAYRPPGPQRALRRNRCGRGNAADGRHRVRTCEDGDAFLVCTDGVWDTIREETITTLLNLAGSVEEWVSSIASVVRTTAKEKQDNYSAVGRVDWLAGADHGYQGLTPRRAAARFSPRRFEGFARPIGYNRLPSAEVHSPRVHGLGECMMSRGQYHSARSAPC